MPLEIEVHQMPSTSSFSRRRLLELLGGAGMGGLAGCQSDQTNGETQTDGSKLLTQADGEARTDRAETSTPDVGEEQSVKPGEQTWPQFQYDTHNSGKHPDSFGPKYSLIPRWSYQTGSRVRLSRHGNLVYSVPDGGSLTALNIETGDIQWTVDRLARYPPIPIGQDLYWGTGQGLIVIDSESGSLQEKIELELISSSPLSGLNGVLFWTNENQRIVAFDTESKSVRWIYDEIEGILGGVYPTSDSVYAGGDGDGKLHAIDPTDGSQQWTFLTGGGYGIPRTPISRGNLVYVGNDGGRIHALDSLSGKERWKIDASSVHSQPIVDDEQLYVGYREFPSGRVASYDRFTGERLWDVKLDGSDWDTAEIMGSPELVGGTFVVGSDNGTVYGLNSDDGGIEWTFDTENKVRSVVSASDSSNEGVCVGNFDGETIRIDSEGSKMWSHQNETTSPRTSPVVGDRLLYIGAQDAKIHAVDERDGTPQWSVKTEALPNSGLVVDVTVDHLYFNAAKTAGLSAKSGETIWWERPVAGGPSAPVYKDKTVYFCESSPRISETVFARQGSNGEVLWSQSTDTPLIGHPAIGDGILCAGSYGGNLYGIDTTDGRILWQYEIGGPIFSGVTIVDGVAHVGSVDGHVYAVNIRDGTEKWVYDTGARIRATPATSSDLLFVASRSSLQAIELDQADLSWEVQFGGVASPVLADGVLYFGGWDGVVRSFEAITGKELASFDTGDGPIRAAPAVVNGTVYVGGADGKVYALDAGSTDN